MLWARNLLFLSVLLLGFLGLRASLFPLWTEERELIFDPSPAQNEDFTSVVQSVDASFRHLWSSRGLTPAPRADDLLIARRLSLALMGTVPSLEEIRQFENWPAHGRVAAWTLHLLRDRRFADYFAQRLGRVYVGTEDGPLIAYRKRRFLAWLSDQLHTKTPYDAMVRQLIAAQGLNTDEPAVNFIAAAYQDDRQGPDPEKLAIRLSRAFLGLRLDCAQCHDHFLEPTWKQRHFQALAAYFSHVRQSVTHVWDREQGYYQFEDRQSGQRVSIAADVPFGREWLPHEGTLRERLAGWVTHPRNRPFARATVNRIWALMFNKPLMRRVEAQTLTEETLPALDLLADDFVTHGFDLHRLILLIASLEVFQLDSAAEHEITPAHEDAWAGFPLTRLRPEQIIGSVAQAASVQTINQRSHILVRLARYANERDFVQRYGDSSDDEFDNSAGTIPQRLLVMNGQLVNDKLKDDLVNATKRIALMAPTDAAAVETAYLMVLSRRPSVEESADFVARLGGVHGDERGRRVADLFWALLNSTELSWNH